jgi:hypothetical protein
MCREHARLYIDRHPVDAGDLVGGLDRFEDRVAEEKRAPAALLFALALLAALLVWSGRRSRAAP